MDNTENSDTIEIPAEGVSGFLLYDPFENRHFFRVYNPTDKTKFEDYRLSAEDIEITIIDTHLSLYKGQLTWNSKTVNYGETS